MEICINGTYGIVCDDLWGILDATVVCRQLNLTTRGQYMCEYASMPHYMEFVSGIIIFKHNHCFNFIFAEA